MKEEELEEELVVDEHVEEPEVIAKGKRKRRGRRRNGRRIINAGATLSCAIYNFDFSIKMLIILHKI